MGETACGSPCYAAPEMIAGQDYVGSCVDIWSTGIILYALVCGYLPFEDANTSNLYRKILQGHFTFPNWVSEELKNLVHKILVQDPKERYTISNIRKHPWYLKNNSDTKRNLKEPPDPSLNEKGMRKPIHLNEIIIKQMELVGYGRDKIIDSVRNRRHDDVHSTYDLLKYRFENNLKHGTIREYLEKERKRKQKEQQLENEDYQQHQASLSGRKISNPSSSSSTSKNKAKFKTFDSSLVYIPKRP